MSNNLTNKIIKSLEVSYFFRIYIETKIGDTLDNILPKDEVNKLDKSQLIKEYNNDSIITPDNWHEKKDILFKQHLETYKDSYTLEQKIKFEIEDLDKLATSERDYKVLVDNYKSFLLTKLQQPQTETKTPDAVEKSLFDFLYNIENKKDFIQDLKETFPTEKGKDIKAIINILKDENIIIHGTREFKKLCNSINTAFERNIGEYSGINDPKYIDELTNTIILKKLNPLIIKYKTK